MKTICHNFYRKIIFNASALTYKDRKRTVRKQIKEREKQTRTKNKTHAVFSTHQNIIFSMLRYIINTIDYRQLYAQAMPLLYQQ